MIRGVNRSTERIRRDQIFVTTIFNIRLKLRTRRDLEILQLLKKRENRNNGFR